MILTIRTPLETINKRVANDGKQVAKETMLDEMIGRSRVGELIAFVKEFGSSISCVLFAMLAAPSTHLLAIFLSFRPAWFLPWQLIVYHHLQLFVDYRKWSMVSIIP